MNFYRFLNEILKFTSSKVTYSCIISDEKMLNFVLVGRRGFERKFCVFLPQPFQKRKSIHDLR